MISMTVLAEASNTQMNSGDSLIKSYRLECKNYTLFMAKMTKINTQRCMTENHTLWGRTYQFSPYKGVLPGFELLVRLLSTLDLNTGTVETFLSRRAKTSGQCKQELGTTISPFCYFQVVKLMYYPCYLELQKFNPRKKVVGLEHNTSPSPSEVSGVKLSLS